MPRRWRFAFTLASAALCASASDAHQSFAEYDTTQLAEVSGTFVQLGLQARDIEADSVSFLTRTNATPRLLKVGDRVTIDGDGDASAPSRGIFRVWSSKVDDPEAAPESLWKDQYPLTEEARKTVAKWRPGRDTVARNCAPKGMPTIMAQPYPLEFVKRGSTILLRLEESDTVRTIQMYGSAPANRGRRTLLGHSIGRWDGASLVVTTTGISWPFIDPAGVPQSEASTLVERFTPAPDGSRLHYALTITDPETFATPVVLKRAWVSRPGERVNKYNCVTRSTARR
jgi:hypothetical protein